MPFFCKNDMFGFGAIPFDSCSAQKNAKQAFILKISKKQFYVKQFRGCLCYNENAEKGDRVFAFFRKENINKIQE